MLRDVFAALGVELTPEIAEPLYAALVTDTGRFQYANTTPKALRLAAELVEAGADVHKVFQGVYETVQFAKLKLLARALDRAQVYEGGRLVVSYLLRTDFAEVGAAEPYSEGIIDYLRAVEGADMAALIREPPRGGTPARRVPPRASVEQIDVSATPRQCGGGGPASRPASPATFRSRRSRSSCAGSSPMPPRALEPSGILLVDKPAGPSSFAIVNEVRRRTGARTGHAGTLDPFATGLLVLLSGRATRLAPAFVGLDKRYLTDVDLTARTSTGDVEGEVVERHEAPSAEELEERWGLRGEIEPPIPAARRVKIGGERLQAAPAWRGGRDAPPALACGRARSRVRGRVATLTCASARGRTCAIAISARRPLPGTAADRSGLFHVEEADSSGSSPATMRWRGPVKTPTLPQPSASRARSRRHLRRPSRHRPHRDGDRDRVCDGGDLRPASENRARQPREMLCTLGGG